MSTYLLNGNRDLIELWNVANGQPKITTILNKIKLSQ